MKLTLEEQKENLEKEASEIVEKYSNLIGTRRKWHGIGIRLLRENSAKSNPINIKLMMREARKNYQKILSEGINCPHCHEDIIDDEIIENSSALASLKSGELTIERTKELILRAHIRHMHTDYDEIISEKADNVAKQKGLNGEFRQEMFNEAKKEARREILVELSKIKEV